VTIELASIIPANVHLTTSGRSGFVPLNEVVALHWADTRQVGAFVGAGIDGWHLSDNAGTNYATRDGGAGGGRTAAVLTLGDVYFEPAVPSGVRTLRLLSPASPGPIAIPVDPVPGRRSSSRSMTNTVVLQHVVAVGEAPAVTDHGRLRVTSAELWSDRIVVNLALDGGDGERNVLADPRIAIQWSIRDDTGCVYAWQGGGSGATGRPGFATGFVQVAPAVRPEAQTLILQPPAGLGSPFEVRLR